MMFSMDNSETPKICGCDDPECPAREVEEAIVDAQQVAIRVHRDDEGVNYVAVPDVERMVEALAKIQNTANSASGAPPQIIAFIEAGMAAVAGNLMSTLLRGNQFVDPTAVPDEVPADWVQAQGGSDGSE